MKLSNCIYFDVYFLLVPLKRNFHPVAEKGQKFMLSFLDVCIGGYDASCDSAVKAEGASGQEGKSSKMSCMESMCA